VTVCYTSPPLPFPPPPPYYYYYYYHYSYDYSMLVGLVTAITALLSRNQFFILSN
jgi:hypothetical protein